MINLEVEAEQYGENWEDINPDLCYEYMIASDISALDFKAGAHSKYVQYRILEEKLDLLYKLKANLQVKKEYIQQKMNDNLGKLVYSQLKAKQAGIRLAEEEIRREVFDLEQLLKELESEK